MHSRVSIMQCGKDTVLGPLLFHSCGMTGSMGKREKRKGLFPQNIHKELCIPLVIVVCRCKPTRSKESVPSRPWQTKRGTEFPMSELTDSLRNNWEGQDTAFSICMGENGLFFVERECSGGQSSYILRHCLHAWCGKQGRVHRVQKGRHVMPLAEMAVPWVTMTLLGLTAKEQAKSIPTMHVGLSAS